MKKAIVRALGIAAAVGLGVALTGCGGSSGTTGTVSGDGEYDGPKVDITFWHGWTGGAAPTLVPKLIEEFNSEHDNIVVKNVPQEWGDIAAKMPLAIKAGKGPDVAVRQLMKTPDSAPSFNRARRTERRTR